MSTKKEGGCWPASHLTNLATNDGQGRKYNRASAVTRFSDFVDGVFLPWARENKRSWKNDGQRAKKLKEFWVSLASD